MATHNQVRLIGYLTSDPKIINEGKPGEEKILMNLKTTRRDADGYSGDRYCEVREMLDYVDSAIVNYGE